MRTKTTILSAVALAAGLLSSHAQVYSANVVGYVNKTFASGQYVQVGVPLQTTSTNSAEDVFPVAQPGDAVLLWNGTSFQTYTFFGPGQWLQPDGSTIGAAPALPVGKGIFFQNNQGGSETNTFVGTVLLSNTNAPITFASGAYNLVGSLPPIGVSSLEDTNLNLPLQAGDAVLIWGGASYQTYTYFSAGQWLYPDGSTIGVSPGVQAAQGFFYQNNQGGTETWTQNLILP